MLSNFSILAEHPKNIGITLKNHQLAMLERCINIEKLENKYGIMNDKPGTGKTFVILSLIYQTLDSKTNNIIVVPQNIYTQWIENIERFSSNLTYLKLINYENLLALYNDPNLLYKYNIILVPSSFYHILSTTLLSLDIVFDRVFFDEIDSISNIICNEINCKFIWFISASFHLNLLGCYNINIPDINSITCSCENNFIDENISLSNPDKNYYICKNIYIDNILENIISDHELLTLNAMDYSIYKVKNEKEVIETILKDKKDLIQFNKLELENANKNIIIYEEYSNNKEKYLEELTINNKNIDNIIMFKKYIINFIIKFEDYSILYINNLFIEDKEADKIIKDSKKEQLKKLKCTFDNIIDMLYNFKSDSSNSILINKLFVVFESIEEIITKLKILNIELLDFYDNFIKNKNSIKKLYDSIININFCNDSENQLNYYNNLSKNCSLIISENENKINLIYERLKINNCCPICYDIFDEKEKIYITSECCSNKICNTCIEEWYHSRVKSCCIFCNTKNIYIKNTVYYINKKLDTPNIFYNKTVNFLSNKLNNDSNNYDINNSISLCISKNEFLEKYLENLKDLDKKIIIFSDYSSVFQFIENICKKLELKYVDLEKGNILEIDQAIYDYKYGNAKILLSNSSLFGCGMNLENSSDIIFVHKMNIDMEKQVIGRAQRIGRKSKLNIIYLLYENESEVNIKKKKFDFINKTSLDQNTNILAFNELSTENSMNYNLNDNNNIVLPTYESVMDVNLETLINGLF